MTELAQPLPAANATNERERLLRLLDHLTNVAIAPLFFLHGAKLSREAAITAASHWRLHALVLLTTFVLFQAALVATRNAHTLRGHFVPLPAASSVQSSVAFTAIATGNVPAAICSASASSIIGIFVTPLVAAALITTKLVSKCLGFERGDRVTIVLARRRVYLRASSWLK